MYKALYVFILVTSFIALVTSCNKEDEDSSSGNATTVNSSFQGNWSGTYSGDGSGTWNIEIDKNGKVTGTAISSPVNTILSINGTVASNGSFTATVGSVSDGSDFIGQLSGTNASGTWSNDEGFTGTWSGTKQ